MTTDKIVLEVIDDLNRRSEIGIKKYGTTLERKDLNLKDFLNHQYEELLDAALYCKRAIKEMEVDYENWTYNIPLNEEDKEILKEVRRLSINQLLSLEDKDENIIKREEDFIVD